MLMKVVSETLKMLSKAAITMILKSTWETKVLLKFLFLCWAELWDRLNMILSSFREAIFCHLFLSGLSPHPLTQVLTLFFLLTQWLLGEVNCPEL